MTPNPCYLNPPSQDRGLCMAGKIRAYQKCPKCGGKFPDELICPTCRTRPTRYYLDIWWKGRLRIYRGTDGKLLDSWERADQLLSTIRHQIGAGNFDPRDYVAKEIKHLGFTNYCQSWLVRREKELAMRDISRAYYRDIKRYAFKYFIPYFGRKNIRDLRDGDLQDFRGWLPPHLSGKTVRNIFGILSQLFQSAFGRKDILVIPQPPKIRKTEAVTFWLSPQEQTKILRKIKEPYKGFITCLMELGCRPGELRALKWDKVDQGNRLITIAAGFDMEVWKPYTKTRRVRTIPYNQRVQDCLDRQPRSLTGFVFVNSRGVHFSHRRLDTVWLNAARGCGFEINLYQATRHSFATQKIAAGFSRDKVGQMMGHSTPQMTMRYEKVVAEGLRELVEGERIKWTNHKIVTKNSSR